MIKEFFEVLYILVIDMGYYLMLGITLVGIFNIFINKEFIARHLGGHGLLPSIKACLFGVPLPLCSCAVVPTGIYLKDKGASNSTVAAFLISTPQTGVDSIVATYGLMGFTMAWFRPLAAFFSGVIGGSVIGLFDKAKKLDKDIITDTSSVEHTHENHREHNHDNNHTDTCCNTNQNDDCESTMVKKSIKEKIIDTLRYSYLETISEISVHFIIGLIISAFISILLPADLLSNIGLSTGILSMLFMIIIGLPMYICSTASIPIALTLLAKGISPGSAFVFLFMGPFTNAASLAILIKKLGKRTVTIYVSAAIGCAIIFGYILDFIVDRFDLYIIKELSADHLNSSMGTFKTIVAIIFIILLVYNLGVRIMNWIKSKKANKATKGEARVFKVEGMTCNNCSGRLQALLLKNDKIDNAQVDHIEKTALVWGEVKNQDVITIIENAGFEGSID